MHFNVNFQYRHIPDIYDIFDTHELAEFTENRFLACHLLFMIAYLLFMIDFRMPHANFKFLF